MATAASTRMSRWLVLLIAVATGLAVASIYYAQPLLPSMGADLGLSDGATELVVTLTQLGYALGLALLLPLGDVLERRKLIAGLGVGAAAALAWMAAAPSGAVLLPAAVLVGTLAVQAQVLVPFAATLAGDDERGSVVGSVMTGLLLGILLARTAAGWIADAAGSWRAVYLVAAVAMLAQAATLAAVLPRRAPESDLRYGALLRSVPAILRDEPVLRRRTLLGALGFAGFSVFWTSVAFLLHRPPYGYGTGTIGLFGLLGAAGALMANAAGRLADRGHVQRTTAAVTALLALSWIPLALGGTSLASLIVGILLLDVAVQGMQISNQTVIYGLAPEARSRINSAYMTIYFLGGAAGSAASGLAWELGRWDAVAALGGALGLAALAALALTRRD
jgi:predicted MFS family arabinose efflux permease